jgi:hypothetical protein
MSKNNTLPQVHFLRDFNALQPDDPRLLGIGLICVDLENVFVGLGESTVTAADVEHVARHMDAGRVLVGATNMSDTERAQTIADSLGLNGVINKGMRGDPSDPTSVMRSKTHEDIFKHAVEAYGFGRLGKRAAMIDDQLKNLRGARKVSDFTDYFWTFPNYFFNQHKGVMSARLGEVPFGMGLIAVQRTARTIRSAKSLINGTHGEW